MLFLIAAVLAVCNAVFLGKPLKKCPYAFYAAAVIISAAMAVYDFRGTPAFVSNYIIALFSRGALATGLWAVVMWTGALPNGSKAMKKLMPIRGEMSIFAAILTLGHNIGFGKTYFVRMFTTPDKMSVAQLAAGIISIIMLAIMLPLTVMSFPAVRKKMKAKLWKRIQHSAYVFYALIYTHVMILSVPFAIAGRSGYLFSVAVYSAVFIGYAVFRVRKQIVLKRKPKTKIALNLGASGLATVLCAAAIIIAAPKTSSANSSRAVKPKNSLGEVSQITSSSIEKPEPSESFAAVSESVPEEVSSSNEELPVSTSPESTSPAIDSAPAESETKSKVQYEVQLEIQPEETSSELSVTEEPIPEEPSPEHEYIYNNGTYTASAYGYDGDIFVTITIENDRIISINADSEESDLWYFDSAVDSVISQIISSQSTEVDAVAGATFSSKGTIAAVANALASAKR